MPRLISQRKKVTPVGKLDDNRFNYLNLQNAQPALGPAPTNNEGYTLQTDGNGKATFSNTLGKLSFANSTITNTQHTDIVIDNRGNGDIILSPLQKVLINTKAEVSGELVVDGEINVKGSNPKGTFPVVNNILYVNENGDDANDGLAMDANRAKRTISGAVKSPYYQEGTTIRVASGHYWEDNPIPLKPSTAVIGDDLRTTFVEPLNKEDDLFHVNSGVYIAFMAMLNLKKGSVERYAPGGAGTYTTGAYCCAFPPKLTDPILVQYSPYIQNCTNQSGPWLFDGSMFRPNQTVQVPLGAGVSSWTEGVSTITVAMNYGSVSVGMAINDYQNVGYANAQTLLKNNIPFFQAEVKAFLDNQYPTFTYNVDTCLRDVGLIITAVAGDARFGGNLRSREAGLAYWTGNYSNITGEQTQTIAAINYLKQLAANVITNTVDSGATYQNIVSQFTDSTLVNGSICAVRLASSFDVITGLIANGPTGLPAAIDMDYGLIHVSGLSSDDITGASTVTNISSTSTGLANAQTLLKLNRSFIQSEVVAWINNTYPGFTYNRNTCYRDVGLILDAISIDGIIGGNIQSRIAGLSYYTGAAINIPGEVTQTVAAIGYINTLAQQIIRNTPVTAISTATQTINNMLTGGADASTGIAASANLISSIIVSGPTTAPAEIYPSLDQYVVTLSSPAVSFGTSSTIYFGRTTVYPVQDKDIPQEWISARALNPSGSGGGALIDGNAPSLKSPIQSFVFDAFTQLNQGGIGIHITNNGYAQLVSVFTIFCDIGVLTENGGIASITNSNANFGNFALMSKGLGHLEFSGIVWNPAYPTNIPNGEYYPQGYWPQNGKVEIYIPDLVNRPHIGLTMEVVPPKTYIDYLGNRVPYVNAKGFPGYLTAAPNTSTIAAGAYTIEGIDTTDIAIGQNFYITDIGSSQRNSDGIMYINSGTIVTDVGFQSVTFDQPINVDGGDPTNDLYFNLYFCGNAYYNVLSSTVDPTVSQPTTPTFIEGEIDETASAIRYARDLVSQVITNTPVTKTYQSTYTQYINTDFVDGGNATGLLEDKFNIVADIIQYGQLTAPSIVKNSQIKNTNQGVLNAAKLVDENKTFIQAEVTSYVDAELVGFQYDQDKCYRDTGLIVDSIAFDLLYGGTSQSTFAGLQYYNQSGYTGKIPSEIVTTTNTIIYVNSLAQQIVQNQTGGIRYQNTVSQVTNLPAGDANAATLVANDFNVITNILNSGTAGVTDIIVPNGIASTTATIINAYNLLQANKAYIQAEAIAFVEATKNLNYKFNRVKCVRDTGIIIDSIATDLMFPGNGFTQSNFAGLQYWNQGTYTGQIAGELTTTTAAINYIAGVAQQVLTNTTGTRYQSTITQVLGTTATVAQVSKVASEFGIITTILTTGTAGVTDLLVSPGSTVVSSDAQNAYNLLQANRAFLQAEAVAYVEATKRPAFTYDKAKCGRDVGYMVDSVSFDVLYGGNRQAIQSGVCYYSFSTSTAIPSEIPETVAAYTRLKTILPLIVTGQTVTVSTGNVVTQVFGTPATNTQGTTITNMVTLITNIISSGTSKANALLPVSLTKSSDPNVANAVSLLQANKQFIEAEMLAYIDSKYSSSFIYDQAKCARDTGIIIDSIVLDVLYPTAGNSQSTFAGLQYYNQSGYTGQIAGELTTTTNAINYIKTLAKNVVQNITTGTRYQNTVTQVTGLVASSAEVTIIDNEFNLITTILTTGTSGVTDLLVANNIHASTNTNVQRAYALLEANKAYIQAEAVAYVEATKSAGYTYSQSLCYRDAGYMVDSVAFDLLYGGNRQAIQSGVYYYAFNNSSSAIPGESTQTVAAFNFAGQLISQLVTGASLTPIQNIVTPVTNLTTATSAEAALLNSKIGVITNIITSGTSVVSSKSPISLTKTTNTNVINAAAIVEANRAFITAETLAFINSTFDYYYDPVLCYRDIGYMVDSVSFDVLHGGNRQAVHSGVYYYGFSDTSAIEGQRIETQFAYNHIADIATALLTGIPVTTTYSTITQVTNIIPATPAEADRVINIINTITDIIVNGPEVATSKHPITLTASTDTNVQNAFNTLLANREFIQAETVSFVNSMFTKFKYNKTKCARDTGIIVDSLAIDLLYNGSTQSNFAGLQYWNQDAYTGQIQGELTTTTAAINYIKGLAQKVVQGITTGTRYQNTVSQVTGLPAATTVSAAIIAGEFDIITNILNSGTSGVTDIIVANGNVNGSPEITNAYALLQANKTYLQTEAIAFVEATKTGGFQFNRDTCARDVGYILDGVYYDIALGSNYNAVTSGRAYQRNVVSSQNVLSKELTQTLSAINYAKAKTALLVNNSTTATTRSNASFDETIAIITNGTSSVVDITFPAPVGGNVNHNYAVALLQANKAFMKAEITAWINTQKTGNISPFTSSFTYNVASCERDVADIVDALCYDVMYGTNWASIIAARAYFTYAVSVLPANERAPSVAAMNRLSTVAQQIVQKTTVVKSSGNTQNQVTTGTAATSAEATTIGSLVSIITNVITANDVTTLPNVVYPSTTWVETGIRSAVTNLANNRAYIIDNTVQNTRLKFSSFFTYNEDNCLRDTGLIVDSIAQDLVYGGTSQSAFAGLQYWNQTGYTGIIANELTTTSNAISYMAGLVSVIVNSASDAPTQAIVDSNFNTLVTILNTGTTGVTDMIVPNGTPSTDPKIVAGYNAIRTVKNSVISQTINWINSNYPTFNYDQTKCSRDLGFILDSISFDLLNGGNRQSIMSAVYYYGYDTTSTILTKEKPQVTAAYNYIKEIVGKIVTGVAISPTRQPYVKQVITSNTATSAETTVLLNNLNLITNIINNGPSVAPSPTPIGLTASTDPHVANAYALLMANRNFIKEEVIAFTNSEFIGPAYNRDTCRRDTGLIIDALAQDILFDGSSQSNFAGLQYWGQNGYTGKIGSEVTTTTNAINYIRDVAKEVVQGITTGLRMIDRIQQITTLPPATRVEAEIIAEHFDLVAGIISNGTAGVTDMIVPNGLTPSSDDNIKRAYALLEANRDYLQAQAVAYVEDTKTSQFMYDKATCLRDVGYIVDSVSFDLLYGGNKQSIHSGISYYAYNSNHSAVANEIEQTTAAYNRIKQILPGILQNTLITDAYQSISPQVFLDVSATTNEVNAIGSNIDLMVGIIANGPSAAIERSPISLNRSTDANVIAAANLLEANRDFIKEEVIAYINYNFGGFQYNQAKCFRDIGYMIDSVSFDLLHGGNRQAIQSGVYYYNFNGNSSAVPTEIPQVTAAYNFMKDLVSRVVTATTGTAVYQTGTVQVTNLPKATAAQATLINNNITLINNIINNGPTSANAKTPIGLTASNDSNIIKAYNLLKANRQFIVDEVTAYIDKTFVTFSYNKNKCFRDVNSILDAVVYDVLWGGNYRSVNVGNGYYARKGRYHIATLEQNVTDPTQFIDGTTVNFYQTSYQSASGYLFEYIGAGSNYSALPQIGRADPIQSHETVQLSNGKVFFTSTDQNGDFRIGPGLVISQATGVLYGRTFQKSLYAEMTPFILVVGA